MIPDGVWLTSVEVAARLRVPLKTLAVWASKGTGPPYARMGRYRRYPLNDLLQWERDQLTATAEGNLPSGTEIRSGQRGRHPRHRRSD
ncbi:helix-turn-helix domain-containing protein [Nocardia neocaledoniensis]|uniref:helix-turn-helix domain-containing protein n=1 Tax=Nocardia neocaledoniensis TaxID=236511 RepID=UPI002458314A|nr:helix-turn-helix domain-containing protein [Nocardia neocaledoniensis]